MKEGNNFKMRLSLNFGYRRKFYDDYYCYCCEDMIIIY